MRLEIELCIFHEVLNASALAAPPRSGLCFALSIPTAFLYFIYFILFFFMIWLLILVAAKQARRIIMCLHEILFLSSNQMSAHNCYPGFFPLSLCSYVGFILYSYTYCIIRGVPVRFIQCEMFQIHLDVLAVFFLPQSVWIMNASSGLEVGWLIRPVFAILTSSALAIIWAHSVN